MWCCRSCAIVEGLTERTRGQSYAARGYCEAGQHHVKERIEWAAPDEPSISPTERPASEVKPDWLAELQD